MGDWMDSQISDGPADAEHGDSSGDSGVADEADGGLQADFEQRVRTLAARDAVEQLDTETVTEHIHEIDNAEVAAAAAESATTPALVGLFEDRVAALDTDTDAEDAADGDGEEITVVADETSGADGDGGDTDAGADGQAPPTKDDTDPADDGVDVKSIAPDVLTVDEAAERDRRWSLLVWAKPGMGKSHFAMSAQSPVVVIDTEGKADELAHKFRAAGDYPDPFIFQPADYDEATAALSKALEILDEYRQVQGVIGSIVVDSMSVMWEWSQQKYVDKFYPAADGPQDVEFSTGFGKGKSDWKQIKNYHNVKFRQPMIDAPYNLVWTAMAEDDYQAQLEDDDRTAEKPAGEKNNVYKVDEVLRLEKGPDGAPVGTLQKSGKVKHRYTGLRYPTFADHRALIDAIDAAEAGRGTIRGVEEHHDVFVVEGDPAYQRDDE